MSLFLRKEKCSHMLACRKRVNTGGAWLSSARVLRCWVKSRNERNPCFVLLVFFHLEENKETQKTAGDKPEEGEDDVKSACPLRPGRHTCYNGRDKEMQSREGKLTSKTRSQFGLQAATRLHEVGIASNRRSAILR